ncbi:MAG: hypothetical protein AAF564_13795, partial [Bacteroidota bacterium]
AASNNRKEVAEILIREGADVNEENNHGYTTARFCNQLLATLICMTPCVHGLAQNHKKRGDVRQGTPPLFTLSYALILLHQHHALDGLK